MVKNWIYEGVISTVDEDGDPRAAPMGFRTIDCRKLIFHPYKRTHTFENMVREGKMILNFVGDETDFFELIWGKTRNREKMFVKNSLRLKDALGLWELKITSIEGKGKRARVSARPTKMVGKAKLYCRAPALALECIIKTSKLGVNPGGDWELIHDIAENAETISRVAPKSKYEKVARKCLRIAAGH